MTVITASYIEQAKGVIVIGPRDLVTPLARDRARELKVEIRVTAGASSTAKTNATPPVTGRRRAEKPPPPVPASGALYRRGAPISGVDKENSGSAHVDPRPAVAVVGAGHVGGMTALRLAECDLFSRIGLIDIVPGLAAGLALDIWHSAALRNFTTRLEGSTDLAALDGADFIVVTAGRARQPGMSRTDLTSANAEIIRTVASAIRDHAPEAIVVVVTNPLEEMTHLLAQVSGLPEERVIGMAGALDTARFRALVGLTGVAKPEEVSAYALGSHGPEMVIPLSQAFARRVPLEQLMEKDVLAAIVERTRDSGAEVVQLLQKGSAYFAPAESAAAMVRAMAQNTNEVQTACVRPRGKYGLVDTRVGLPVRLTRAGAGEVVVLNLRPSELQALREAAARIAARIRELS